MKFMPTRVYQPYLSLKRVVDMVLQFNISIEKICNKRGDDNWNVTYARS